MSNPLIRRLEVANTLNHDDRALLVQLCDQSELVAAHTDLKCEGDRPDHVHLILDGFACRYKTMADGSRHIVALLVPGDFCDLHVAILDEIDHSIATITACSVVTISRSVILDLINHPRIARALWWATLVDQSVLREWLVNLGQRQADERMAHLFCEMLLRLRCVSLTDGNRFSFPLTQKELGDVLGFTSIHVNRTLQDLRSAGLIVFQGRYVEIPNADTLMAFCAFDPNYLHLTPRQRG